MIITKIGRITLPDRLHDEKLRRGKFMGSRVLEKAPESEGGSLQHPGKDDGPATTGQCLFAKNEMPTCLLGIAELGMT